MAVTRKDALTSVKSEDESDPHLKEAFGGADTLRVALEKEANRHKEALANGDRGFIGRLLGAPSSAPITVAFISIIIGCFVWVGALIVALKYPANAEFWSTQSNRGLTFALTALGYIFGRGAK